MIAQLQADNTHTTGVYDFVVEGKPFPDAALVDQLRRILAGAGIEVADRETAPPEFWRSLLDASPVPTRSHYDKKEGRYLSTGLREVRVRRDVLHRVVGALDLGALAEEDRQLLLDLDAVTSGGSIVFPPHRAWVAQMVVDSFLPTVRECSISVEGSKVHLTPLPVVGKVRIPKAKLDAIAVDTKSENPRLDRIQTATMHAPIKDLLAEARRGTANPKADGDKDSGGDKIEIRCPRTSHADARKSAYVERYADGVGGSCSGDCTGWGSNYPGLIRAYHPRLTWDEACVRAEQILGLEPWGSVPEAQRVQGDEIEALARIAEQAAPLPDPATMPMPVRKWDDEPAPAPQAEEAPAREPAAVHQQVPPAPDEEPPPAPKELIAPSTSPAPSPPPAASSIAQWLAQQPKIGASEEGWIAGRGLDPTVLAMYVFMRAASRSALPTWDGITVGDASFLTEWAEVCVKTGHTLLLPTVAESGAVVGVRARRTLGAHPAKTKTPSIQRGKQRHTMPQRGVLANLHAIKALRGEAPWPEWTVIVEGEPDFLTACQLYPAAAVISIYKGKDAWTQALAAKIPDGSKVALLVDVDGPGRKYRRGVVRSLGKRVRFFDAPGRKHDVNKLLVDGKADTLTLDQLKQIPVGEHRELTELGNARRLHDEHGGELAYHASSSKWYVLVDGVWEAQAGKDCIAVRARIQALAAAIEAEAEEAATEEGATRTLAWARTSQKSSVITATEKEARVLFAIGDVFDDDPFLIGVKNGVLDLRTGELVEDPGPSYVSRRLSVAWDQNATAARWEKFLEEIFLGDRELIAYMRRTVGYWITGSAREQKFWLLHGSKGGNGKGTFLSIIQALLEGLARPFKSSLICRRPGQPGWDLSSLEGLRLAYINEAPRGGELSVEVLKNYVSEDLLYGERKGKDPKPFRQTHKLAWALNDIPPLPNDPAMFRRLQLVLFGAHFENPDETLGDALRAELPGILVWAVAGAVEWYRDGLRPPPCVVACAADLRDEADTVGRWVEARCERDPLATVDRAVLHRAYQAWAPGAGTRLLAASEFYTDLDRKGFAKVKVQGERSYRGLRLKVEHPGFEQEIPDVTAILDNLRN